eukprot:gene1713-biopygen818
MSKKRWSKGAVNGADQKAPVISKKGLVETQPLLYFSEAHGELRTNFLVCKEMWTLYLMEKHGNAGRFILVTEHYEPPAVDFPDIDPESPRLLRKRAEMVFLKREEMRIREEAELKECYPKMYAFIMGQLSTESKAKLQSMEEWEGIEEDYDVLSLWMLITVTHLASSSGMIAVDKQKCREKYYKKLYQKSSETLAAYKKKFDDALEIFDAIELAKLDAEDPAVDFIANLDLSRFSRMRADFENQATLVNYVYPKTLTDTSSGDNYADKKGKFDKGKKKQQYKNGGAKAAPKYENTSGQGSGCWACKEKGHMMRDCLLVKEI